MGCKSWGKAAEAPFLYTFQPRSCDLATGNTGVHTPVHIYVHTLWTCQLWTMLDHLSMITHHSNMNDVSFLDKGLRQSKYHQILSTKMSTLCGHVVMWTSTTHVLWMSTPSVPSEDVHTICPIRGRPHHLWTDRMVDVTDGGT